MSGRRGIGDGFAFQRLLWLLIGTVIVPTILLSLFGVTAIRNQGAAVQQELARVQGERLEVAARVLIEEIDEVQVGAVSAARTCAAAPEAPCTLERPGVLQTWSWRQGEAIPPALQSLGVAERPIRDEPVWFTPADGSAPVAVLGVADSFVAWQLDPGHLQDRLDRHAAAALPDDVALQLVSPRPGPATSWEEMAARWQEPSSQEVLLQRPLTSWRLQLDFSGDPTAAALRTNAWLYPISLVVLVALVVVGATVTLFSASREIRLSRLQTDFVSSVSHELRTPLTSIRLFVETLQSGRLRDPEKIDECLELLSQETDRLDRMIERVLDWARMEAGRRVYEFEAVQATELTHDAIRALRSQHLLVDENIEVDVPDGLPPLHVDRDAIVEALVNLLQNAVKYTPQPRRIKISARTRSDRVGLSVEDNGPGIAKSDRKRIFEKFYQADTLLSSPTQQGGNRGSGLGLSIVRAVARAHGGRVELDSEPGEGSRFTLWLPTASAMR